MTELAEYTDALRQKDSEKTALEEEIQMLEDSDDVNSEILESKRQALAAVKEEIKAIGAKVREASAAKAESSSSQQKKGTPSSGSKTNKDAKQSKKSTKTSSEKQSKDGAGSKSSKQSITAGSILSNIGSFAMVAGVGVIENRGYLLFGIAAAGIYFFGDQLSV